MVRVKILNKIFSRLEYGNTFYNGTWCWNWTGCTNFGYGLISVNQKLVRVHRIMYETYKGFLFSKAHIDHLCRNRACCNPDHLEAVSHKENIRRGLAGQWERTCCPNGHEYIEGSFTYRKKRGETCKMCLICASSTNKKSNDKAKLKRIAGICNG